MLTIPPYSPWLNPAEKVILAAKRKIRLHQNQNK